MKNSKIKIGTNVLFFDRASARDVAAVVKGVHDSGNYIISIGKKTITSVHPSLLKIV